MANAVPIRILFESEEFPERALPIAAGMIRLLCVPKNLPRAAEAEQIPESNLSLTGAKAAVGVLWLLPVDAHQSPDFP